MMESMKGKGQAAMERMKEMTGMGGSHTGTTTSMHTGMTTGYAARCMRLLSHFKGLAKGSETLAGV